jgi:hypothetical protein
MENWRRAVAPLIAHFAKVGLPKFLAVEVVAEYAR